MPAERGPSLHRDRPTEPGRLAQRAGVPTAGVAIAALPGPRSRAVHWHPQAGLGDAGRQLATQGDAPRSPRMPHLKTGPNRYLRWRGPYEAGAYCAAHG